MNYQETLAYFYSQLPMFHRIGAAAYKADLTKTLAIADMLGNPQTKLKAVHIAGTNGKGSVSHMLASILQEAGYQTGLYTSPHLKDFRERIRINGRMIPKSVVSEFVNKYKDRLDEIQPSFFEMSFGLCLEYFKANPVDVAVMETGMGGRLDSTNILSPDLCVITNISLDHTDFLGGSLAEIATEKAGIIKAGIPVVIGETRDETRNVFRNRANALRSNLHFAEEFYTVEKLESSSNEKLFAKAIRNADPESFQLECPLPGNYQLQNIRTLLTTIDVLNDWGYTISRDAVIAGIRNTRKNTGLRGRWEVLRKKPLVICDTGHNPAGITNVIGQILSLSYRKLHIVLGFVADKDIDKIIPLFPAEADYYFCRADIPRGLDAGELQSKAALYHLKGKTYHSVAAAYAAAVSAAAADDLVFIGGSTFVVAEVI